MRYLALILASYVALQPAFACHRFSKWYYPYPQPKCQVASVAPGRIWYVEIVKYPESWQRDQAIDLLRIQLNK